MLLLNASDNYYSTNMNIDSLIRLLENKLIVLNDAKTSAFAGGDLDRINALEAEILETQNTVYRLRLLQTTEQAAAVANTSVQTMMVAGVEAIKGIMNNPDIKQALGGYDISSYATDPLHEQKVATILAGISVMTNPESIDTYIQSVAPGSPVTGAMVLLSAKKYAVDSRLLIALMQQDSSLGTAGVGASTFNPGNVGNTGTETKIFPSWADGVDAVASWLSTHRATEVVPTETTVSADDATSTDIQMPADDASTTPTEAAPESDLTTPTASSTEAQ
jgi:hypothetical protein